MANNLDQTGVMQVNGAWVTRVQYEAAVLGQATGTVQLRFMQGRAQVARTSLPRDELVGLLGEQNARAIEKHVASDADKYLSAVKGELKGTGLHYREVSLVLPEVSADENAISVSWTRTQTAQEREAEMPESPAGPQPNDARSSEAGKEGVNEKATVDDRTETQSEAARKKANRGSTTTKESVPAHIASKYLVKDDTYYFDDQSVAFVDKGSRFTVQTHNKAVIQDLVEIAKARDWHEVTVTGTESFRREAWKEAHAAGLTVKGYTPSAVELAAGDRQRQHRSASVKPAADPAQPEAPDAGRPADTPRPQRRGNPDSGVLYGTLVAYGEAPYRHDASKSMSYYVTLKGEDGKERTLWGVGLSDAIKEAQSAPGVGDFVGVKRVGSTPVNVASRQVDANGEISTQRIAAKRHDWVIEKAAYFKDNPDLPGDVQSRPSSNSAEQSPMATEPVPASTPNSSKGMTRDQEIAAAVRSAATTREELQLKYPDLNKAVLQHLGSHAQFAEAYVKAGLIREADRMQVIAQMRERLANQIERGAPIKEPDNKQVNTLIRRSVDRVAADIGRAPVEIQPRVVAEGATPKAPVRDEVQVRA